MSWNKGFTKKTHPSVFKTSETMKRKGIDNFRKWREVNKKSSPPLIKDGDLAELIGVTLGDGHIRKYARTEEIRIISNANNPGFVKRYSKLVEKIFSKKPYVVRHNNCNAVRISLYQNRISERMTIPAGKRRFAEIIVPDWILGSEEYIVRYLRGLYEAEGCFCIHRPTYTYKFLFSNRNESMLRNVYDLMKMLGFHPHMSPNQVQISKKREVYEAKELLKFRCY